MNGNSLNSFGRYFKILCTGFLTDPGFYAAALLIFAMAFIAPALEISGKSYSIPAVLFDPERYRYALTNIDCCAQLVAADFDRHTLFTILLPIIVSFPAMKIFFQHKDSIQKTVLIRTSKRVYKAGIFVTSFLSGAVISFIGIMLYIITAFSIFPPITVFDNAELIEMYGGAPGLMSTLVKKAANVCVVSGMFSVFCIIVCAAVRDKFFSLTLPVMIQYISMKIYIIYSNWLYSDMARSQNKLLNFLCMMLPYSLTQHYTAWEYQLDLPYFCFFGFAAIVIAGEYLIFDKLMERSVGR